jgi:hypothetical protein
MLGESGFFAEPASAATKVLSSAVMKQPHYPTKAKSCIFLFMYGGPSQMDTFDPKPELVKRSGQPMPNLDNDPLFKIRNPEKLLGSPRKFHRCGQSGLEISDFYPWLGRVADDLCVLRGCYADSFAHGGGLLQMNTGFLRQGYPSLGSWVTYGLGTENQNLPSFVVLLDHRGGPISGPPNWGSGFMPAAFQGTQFRTSGDPVLNLSPPQGRSLQDQRAALDLLKQYNEDFNAASPQNTELAARVASYELAFRMQASTPEAVDLSKETEETKRLYGMDDPRMEKFGRRLLMARRLVERGVRFIQVYSGGAHLEDTWDAHSDVQSNHENHCGETDKPMYGLLTDLRRRGLLDETLIFWAGEFGRTPTGQNGKGRDHSPRGFSTWMAGAGVKGGQAVGATDELGYRAVENKMHVHDLHATALHLMGMDHTRLTYFTGGRNMRLTDVSGRVVKEILA